MVGRCTAVGVKGGHKWTCKQEGEGLLSQHLSRAGPGEACVYVCGGQEGGWWWWWGRGGQKEKVLECSPIPWGIPLFSVAHQSPNDTSSLLYNPMIPGLVTKAGTRGRHRRTHSVCMCTLHSKERCLRHCSQDGRCWPMSRGGLYHFPVAFYFNTGKSS